MTQFDLADRINVTVQSVSQWENDKTVPTYARLRKLAEILGEDVAFDATQEPSEASSVVPSTSALAPVIVAGKLAAGVFREVDDLDQTEATKLWIPVDQRFPHARRMAFDVEGNSMNANTPRPIMDGDRIICVSFEDVASEVKVRDGLVVVVERTRDGGHTREWSVKKVKLFPDRIEFQPQSTEARHKPIIVRRDAEADDGVQVEIIGLVRSLESSFDF